MEKYIKIIFGLLLVIAGIYVTVNWLQDFLALLRGSIGVIIALVGLLFLLMGFNE